MTGRARGVLVSPSSPPAAAATDPQPVGNEAVLRRLIETYHADRLHHCLILEGPRGVGKAAAARRLAMLVNCDGPAELLGPRTTPCGECWSCRHIARGEHPDIIEIGLDPERATPIISVRQARALLGALQLHPFHARQRFVIIDPADAMTQEAANALLKTLEEPPTRTGFILITERTSDLLPTVRSRSQRVRFGPVEVERVAAWLDLDDPRRAWEAAVLSDGCPDRARELVDGELDRWRQVRDELVAVLRGPTPERLAWTEKQARGDRDAVRQRLDRILDIVSRLARDCLRLEAGSPSSVLYNADQPELIAAMNRRLGPAGVARVDAAVAEARRELEANVNNRLALDALLAVLHRELGGRA
ncbi:MAG: AAA family ATPase [Deltaproteobacteria bacterium]|nr:MAG: AAA family ATPase [Deltaproteobacteria bacterium]